MCKKALQMYGDSWESLARKEIRNRINRRCGFLWNETLNRSQNRVKAEGKWRRETIQI